MSPAELAPPPIYSQQQSPDEPALGLVPNDELNGTYDGLQILLIPTTDTVKFQKGFLGADGERAAIEGELQIKGSEPSRWRKLTISLRTVEAAYQHEIELGYAEVDLLDQQQHFDADALTPSSFPFSIPLTADTPQCIHTPHSSLSHALMATLHPADGGAPFTRRLLVHTRRFTSHVHTFVPSPETHSLESPTLVQVEVPRTTFQVGEAIPVYVTIPPPRRELVVDEGLRLRNVRAELVRIVKVKREESEEGGSDTEDEVGSDVDVEDSYDTDWYHRDGPSSAAHSRPAEKLTHSSVHSPVFMGASYRTAVSRSGASCRFHSSRPIKLRFILHPSMPSSSPPDHFRTISENDYESSDSDTQCVSITQTTLLHAVTFRLNVHVSFVDMTTRTEHISTITIPLVIIPPPAPLPEVEEWVHAAYSKKHDRPPVKTVRHDESEVSAPQYQEGEAGPSYTQNGAPPPFEDRDVPPPPFLEASSSSGLPTFLESEAEIYISSQHAEDAQFSPGLPAIGISGEGIHFGFSAAEQFDGHSDDLDRSVTPPPSLEMATQDTNVTGLVAFNQPEHAMEALGLILEQQESSEVDGEPPPPPPPAMDDPSDPPPSIDSDFRSPAVHQNPTHPSSPTAEQHISPAPLAAGQSHSSSEGHAPPPYLVPESEGDQEHVTRPPPYMDLMPPHP